ncbi:MAG: hypothetical protein NTY68_01890 [Candidatus Micrarchaeota archaeon]|nr:hypothetical protein [Candidatus Micrarchaeota archaeon]
MAKYRRLPLKSIDEFKWHTKIIKTFGKKALILYTAFPKNGADVDESTLNNLLQDDQQRTEIMKFMVDNGLIELAEGPSKVKKEEEKKEIKRKEEPEEEIKPKEEEIPEEKPKARKPERKKEEEISISYEPPKEEEEIQPEAAEEEIKPEAEEEEKPKARKAPPKEEEIEEEAPEEEIKPEIEAEEAPEEIKPEAEEEIPEEKPKTKKAPPKEEAPAEEEKPEEEITSENEEQPEEKEEKPSLTPAEMIVHDKYDDLGVAIFRLIDGKRSVAEVAKESNTSQEKVMEVLKYLDEVGLISLGGGEEAKGAGAPQAPGEEKFAPLSEESELSTMSIDEQKEGIKVAKVRSSGFVDKMKMNVSIVFKYGKSGRELLEFISEKKEANVVNLAIKLNIPISVVEDIVNFLKAQNYVELSLMSREDIKKSFGYDAYIIYKRYGKKGVVFYEVIDKDIPLKRIAELISEKDATKIIEIFKLIRDVLGIDLPINDDAIRRELVF